MRLTRTEYMPESYHHGRPNCQQQTSRTPWGNWGGDSPKVNDARLTTRSRRHASETTTVMPSAVHPPERVVRGVRVGVGYYARTDRSMHRIRTYLPGSHSLYQITISATSCTTISRNQPASHSGARYRLNNTEFTSKLRSMVLSMAEV